MNPLTNVKNLQKLNDRELELGIIGKKSWHDEYKDSAWVFIGGLPYDLTEGDVICIFSQYGEIVNLNLIRDHKTGKSKGFAFLCFEDQRSTVLSVDNLNGIKILGRTIRVDHVKDYKVPKEHGDEDDLTKKIRDEGCAPKLESSGEDDKEEASEDEPADKKIKKEKKKKKKEKKKKKKRDSSSSDSSDSDEEEEEDVKPVVKVEIKEEKPDKGYDKALNTLSASRSGTRDDSQHRGDKHKSKDRDRGENRSSFGHGGRNKGSRDSDDNDEEDGSSDERDSSRRRLGRDNGRDRNVTNGYSGRDGFKFNNRSNSDNSRRDRETERDRNRERDRSREREMDRSRERDRDNRQRDRNRERDSGDRYRDRTRDGGENRNNNERDRQRRDDRDLDRRRDRSRERDRHR